LLGLLKNVIKKTTANRLNELASVDFSMPLVGVEETAGVELALA